MTSEVNLASAKGPVEPWDRIKTIFDRAVRLKPPARRHFLDEACQGEEELRRSLDSLLALDTETTGWLRGSVESAARAVVEPTWIGRRLGAYRVLAELGEGGMGAVYLAERADGEFEQRVAIKMIGAGALHGALRQRFLNERQILARLEHPHIAHLLDGGTTEDGMPYLVMERVEGATITRYCDQRRLGLKQRLRLFGQVCEAVEFAHRNLVVHRDLKPENILVTRGGEVKLLDFGIAKGLDQGLEDDGLSHGVKPVMTPKYASPEQVAGRPVTTATDVYSLGVVLYELLVGEPPFTGRMGEVLGRILDDEMPDPAERLEELALQRRQTLAAAWSTPLPRLLAELRGDLGSIVRKATAKRQEDRYASVRELSCDLQRYLNAELVEAHPPRMPYLLRQWTRRHRAAFLGGLVAVLLLLAGAIGTGSGYLRATRASERAQRAAAEASAIQAFLEGVLSSSDVEPRNGDLHLSDLLGPALARAKSELRDQPQVLASILHTIGESYLSLEDLAPARATLTEALALRRQSLGPAHPETLASWRTQAALRNTELRLEEAEALARCLLVRHRQLFGDEHPATLDAVAILSQTLIFAGRFREAEKCVRPALRSARETLGETAELTLELRDYLAWSLLDQGRLDEAEHLDRETVALTRRAWGDRHPETLLSIFALAFTLSYQRSYAETEALLVSALDDSRQVFGDRGLTLAMQGRLARALAAQGRLKEAWPLFEATAARQRELYGADNLDVVETDYFHGLALLGAGRAGEAAVLLADALSRERIARPDVHVMEIRIAAGVTRALRTSGSLDEAEPLSRHNLELAERVHGRRHSLTLEAELERQLVLAARGQNDDLAERLEPLLAEAREAIGERHPVTREIASAVGGSPEGRR